MFAVGLLICVVLLRAFSAQAEVVQDFNTCREFFYENTEPGGMDQNASKICQVYGEQSMRSYYATLYSTHHRIPLYSAYTFNPECINESGRTDIWHVEPQLSGYPTRYMVLERDCGLNISVIKINQSVSSDYSGTRYDRGHLNPSSFDCGAGRNATFTLTNAAPMNHRFNAVHWGQCEKDLRRFLVNQLSRDGYSATAYIVTGTVPDATVRIPQRENPGGYKRVSVPSHVWTAVCYKHRRDDRKSFSFGYMGKNQQQPGINLMSVFDLNDQLSRLYSELSGTGQRVNIFVDVCFGDKEKLNMVKKKFKTFINAPEGVPRSTAEQNSHRPKKRPSSSDSQSSAKKVEEMRVKLAFDSMNTSYTVAEDLTVSAGSACLITHVKPLVRTIVLDELRKRDVCEWPDAVYNYG